VTVQQLNREAAPVLGHLLADDLNVVFNNRIVNLKKIYPYIPESLNRILLHFSVGAKVFYDKTEQLLTDLAEVRDEIKEQQYACREH
jgi:hypothetical protein